MSNDKEKIREVFEEVYAANVRSRDLQGYAEMYTEAALWMPPDQSDRLGIPQIVEGFAAQIANQDIDPIFVAEEIEVMGHFGYVIGISQATIHPHDGSPSKEVKFRALWLMKKEGDIWKIDRQIWNVKPL
ncbi:SgcJ/EcaC family oxidoreductase [Microcoleus sp. F10-C6]|uniref:SgcJ/EcaC family oxidoreductase n=1 Tax=unclassified Microcoleus TaxID=2642155 RepID=UPI002FD71724